VNCWLSSWLEGTQFAKREPWAHRHGLAVVIKDCVVMNLHICVSVVFEHKCSCRFAWCYRSTKVTLPRGRSAYCTIVLTCVAAGLAGQWCQYPQFATASPSTATLGLVRAHYQRVLVGLRTHCMVEACLSQVLALMHDAAAVYRLLLLALVPDVASCGSVLLANFLDTVIFI
jgi:hypothetical protein